MQCCRLILFQLFFSVKIQQREFIFAHSSINSLVQTNDFCLVLTIFQNRSEIVEGRMIGGEIFLFFFCSAFFSYLQRAAQICEIKKHSSHFCNIFYRFFFFFF